jgi:hypothetical protein
MESPEPEASERHSLTMSRQRAGIVAEATVRFPGGFASPDKSTAGRLGAQDGVSHYTKYETIDVFPESLLTFRQQYRTT